MKQLITYSLFLISFSLFSQGVKFQEGETLVIEIPVQENNLNSNEGVKLTKDFFKNKDVTEISNGISVPMEKNVKVSYPMQIMKFNETIKYNLIVQFKEKRHRIILKDFEIYNTFKEKNESLEIYYANTKKKWQKKIRLKLKEAKDDAIFKIKKALKPKAKVETGSDDW